VLSDVADVTYKCTSVYDAEFERGIAYNDPEVGIQWPEGLELIVSERDAQARLIADISDPLPFRFDGLPADRLAAARRLRPMAQDSSRDVDLAAENARLTARVEQLEAEVATLRADTVQTVAQAQETLYWFERWGVDFNRLFSRPEMELLRKGFRGLRTVYRK